MQFIKKWAMQEEVLILFSHLPSHLKIDVNIRLKSCMITGFERAIFSSLFNQILFLVTEYDSIAPL